MYFLVYLQSTGPLVTGATHAVTTGWLLTLLELAPDDNDGDDDEIDDNAAASDSAGTLTNPDSELLLPLFTTLLKADKQFVLQLCTSSLVELQTADAAKRALAESRVNLEVGCEENE